MFCEHLKLARGEMGRGKRGKKGLRLLGNRSLEVGWGLDPVDWVGWVEEGVGRLVGGDGGSERFALSLGCLKNWTSSHL